MTLYKPGRSEIISNPISILVQQSLPLDARLNQQVRDFEFSTCPASAYSSWYMECEDWRHL